MVIKNFPSFKSVIHIILILRFCCDVRNKHAKFFEKKCALIQCKISCHFGVKIKSDFCALVAGENPTQTRKENFIMATKRIQLLVILTNHRLFIWQSNE